jgi:hypothetical protein
VKTQPARDTRAQSTKDATAFSFSSGAKYAVKEDYLAKHVIFTITAIEYQEDAGFDGAPRWAVTVTPEPDDGETVEIITLQSNDKRDTEMRTAAEHIAKNGPIRNVRLVKHGKAYYFETVAEAKAP